MTDREKDRESIERDTADFFLLVAKERRKMLDELEGILMLVLASGDRRLGNSSEIRSRTMAYVKKYGIGGERK